MQNGRAGSELCAFFIKLNRIFNGFCCTDAEAIKLFVIVS